MKPITKILTLTGCLACLAVFAAGSEAPANGSLKSTQEELKTSIQNLVDVKIKELTPEEKERLELEASRKALQDVIKFSIAETENLIDRLNALNDLTADYDKLRDQYIYQLRELLDYQKDYLVKAESDELDLAAVKKLASAFKKWRSENYDPLVRDVLNFLLVIQGNSVLAVAQNRRDKIAADLGLFKNSKIIKVDILAPLLNDASDQLTEAAKFNMQAQDLLFDASSTPVALNSAASTVLVKVKQAYMKFLDMSALVRKMLGK